MQNAVPVGDGAMIAVLGMQTEEIKKFIENQKIEKGICEIANDNATGQVIISGNKECIDTIKNKLKEKKIKTIPLKVSAPFHCSLMKPAAEEMSSKINSTEFKKPLFEIVANVNATAETSPNEIKKLLIDQIYSTVKWRETLLLMEKQGSKNFCRDRTRKIINWNGQKNCQK